MSVATAVLITLAAAQESWVNRPKEPPAGVEHRTFRSPSMNRDVGYQIYLPTGYATSDQRYPVIYYLHGMTDCETNHPYLFPILDAAIKSGDVKPTILVYTMCGRTSWFADAPDGSVMGETVFVKELIPHIDATQRTIAAKTGRAVQGWSMGGQGAIRLAMAHPDLFAAAVSFGGGFRRASQLKGHESKVLERMYGGDADRFDAESPAGRVASDGAALKGKTAMRLVVGDKDFLLEDNRRLKGLLEQAGIDFEYEEMAGIAHDARKVFEAQGLAAHRFCDRHFKL